MTLPTKIFDHNILKQNRNRSVNSFSKSNFIHRLISDIILDIILDQKKKFNNILEIGALDNYLSKIIKQNLPKSQFFTSELSPSWSKLNNFCPKIIMNDEFIAFKKESFDLICSNFNAHFYNDFLGFLIQSNYCLKQDGFFIGSFIGNDSLELLKQVFYEIETEKYQKFTPRFIPTTDVKTSGMMMQKANFKDVISIIEEVEISYTDPKKILLDIKNSGLSNIMFNRGKEFVTKNFLNEVYKKLENSKINNQIKINLNIVIVFGWKK